MYHTSRHSLSIIFSTIGPNIDTFISSLNKMNIDSADEIVIIIQKIDGYEKSLNNIDPKYVIIKDSGIGISRSRNIGIKKYK